MGIIIAILVFSFIIIFHELGHYTLAKLNGIEVEEFSLGLGPTIVGKEFHGTKFCINLLPFGGACVMGEDDVDDMSEGSFNSKSVWSRISVIAAGPIFNFILAFILSVIMVGWIGYDEPVLSGVLDGYSAQEAGIQAGDRIVEIDGDRIHFWREISMHNLMNPGDAIEVVYERDGQKYEATLIPEQDEDGNYLYGFLSSGKQTRANPLTAIQYGAYTVEYMIEYALDSLKLLFSGHVGIQDMSGPVGMVNMMDETYQQTKSYGIGTVILNFVNIAVLLSANLGVMNLLPIPALDGGRLVFLFTEAIRGKRIAPNKEGWIHMVGLVVLLGLMIVVMFSDIIKLF